MLGGGEHSFLDLLSHLPSHWENLVIVPHEGDLSCKLRVKEIPTLVRPLPSMKPWYVLEVLNALRVYAKICKRYQPDLIYANGSRAAFYGGIIGRLMDLPVIWHCRTADADPFLDCLLTRLSDRIIANSQATAKRFGIALRNKVEVVYNGLDLDWLRDYDVGKPALVQPSWKIILVVARISKWKRHDLALTAFQQVAEIFRECHLIYIGAKDRSEPEWWETLQERTHRSPFSERVHWLGHVDDVRPWYRVASLLLLPSENEPFGRVVVEAMACGVPVIATKSGGALEILREGRNGMLVTPGDAEAMADAILSLLRNDHLRTSLIQSGKVRAQDFGLDRHIGKMVEIFDRLAYRPDARRSRPVNF